MGLPLLSGCSLVKSHQVKSSYNHTTDALVDTGASSSFVNAATALRAATHGGQLLPKNSTILLGGKKEAASHQELLIDVVAKSGSTTPCCFKVLDSEDDVVLGMDVLLVALGV